MARLSKQVTEDEFTRSVDYPGNSLYETHDKFDIREIDIIARVGEPFDFQDVFVLSSGDFYFYTLDGSKINKKSYFFVDIFGSESYKGSDMESELYAQNRVFNAPYAEESRL